MKIVIDAMQERQCQAGDQLIKEGDSGDLLYVIGEGEFNCNKVIGGKNVFLKTYKSGDLFGELSLMYNTKRAASIVCSKKGVLFGLDRQTFTNIVQDSAIKRRKEWKAIIDKI